ncbi:hypothetical protein Tco_0048094 [Tanacetum coccineum]
MAGVDIDTLTIEQYLALSREKQAPGVVKPEIRGNVNFEIKSQFMRELRKETFSGNKNEDAHDHVDRVLNIVSLFSIREVTQVTLLLRVFPFTLTGTAKRWVDRLTPGTVNTWDLFERAFIQRMPSLEELMNKHQEESIWRSAEMNEWIKKLQESVEINTRNQSVSLKNLETQIKQLTQELHSRATDENPSPSTRQCKVVNVDHETPSELNNLHGVYFLPNSEEGTTEVLQ